jgi:hypothetical protein
VRLFRIPLAILVAGLALAACSTGGRAHAGAAPSPTGMSDAQLQPLVNDLVRCVRQNGAPGMPDLPVRNGHIVLPNENTVDEATKRNIDAARQACQSVENRIPPSVLEKAGDQNQNRQGPTAADVPKLRQYAKCMRDNGIPDWPDPKADGSFPLANTPIAREGKSPRIITAMQACDKYWNGGLRFS